MLQVNEVGVLTNHPSVIKDCFFHRLLLPNCDTSVQVKKRSTHMKRISQQVVIFSIYLVEQKNCWLPTWWAYKFHDCFFYKKAWQLFLNAVKKEPDRKNIGSHLTSPQRGSSYICSLPLSVNSVIAELLLRWFIRLLCRPGILCTTATSAMIKAQLAIGTLIWPGSKGEGQSCPAVLQEN